MDKPKARYSGGIQTQPVDFRDAPKLKKDLLTIYQKEDSKGKSLEKIELASVEACHLLPRPDGNVAEAFVNELLEVARPFLVVSSIKDQMGRKDYLILHSKLESLSKDLRNISPELGCLLDFDRGVVDLAADMEALAARIKKAGEILKKRGRSPRPNEFIKPHAKELCRRLILVLQKHFVPITAPGTAGKDYTSDAEEIIRLIFGSIPYFPAAPITIRDYIGKIKSEFTKRGDGMKDSSSLSAEIKSVFPGLTDDKLKKIYKLLAAKFYNQRLLTDDELERILQQ